MEIKNNKVTRYGGQSEDYELIEFARTKGFNVDEEEIPEVGCVDDEDYWDKDEELAEMAEEATEYLAEQGFEVVNMD